MNCDNAVCAERADENLNCRYCSSCCGRSSDDCDGHARLNKVRAAAPDLLEALNVAEEVLRIMRFPETSKAHNALLLVQVAIKKAGG